MLHRLAIASLAFVFVSNSAPAQGLFPYKCCPRPSYSPLHYWTPNAYRVAATFTPYGSYTYAHVDGVWPTQIVRFPCPAVDPAVRYIGTGLPYDPAGPFAPMPAAAPAESAPPTTPPAYSR